MADDDQPDQLDQNDQKDTPESDKATSATDELGDGGKKALAAERAAKKAAEKHAAELTKRLQEIEDRDKSEAQKLLDRAEAAEKRLAATEAEALRTRVALAKGLTSDLASRLRGDDEDALLEDADALLALMGTKRKPAGDIDQGPKNDTKPGQLSRDQIKDMSPADIVKAKKEGRLDAVLTGK